MSTAVPGSPRQSRQFLAVLAMDGCDGNGCHCHSNLVARLPDKMKYIPGWLVSVGGSCVRQKQNTFQQRTGGVWGRGTILFVSEFIDKLLSLLPENRISKKDESKKKKKHAQWRIN